MGSSGRGVYGSHGLANSRRSITDICVNTSHIGHMRNHNSLTVYKNKNKYL